MSNIISFFQLLIKGGVGIRAGGLENFSKINKRGDDYSVLESKRRGERVSEISSQNPLSVVIVESAKFICHTDLRQALLFVTPEEYTY